MPEHENILTDISNIKLIQNIGISNKINNITKPIDNIIATFNNYVSDCKNSINNLYSSSDDIETIIQENRAMRENKQTCVVMITLLSLPKNYYEYVRELQNDYYRFIGKETNYGPQKNLTQNTLQSQFIDILQNGYDPVKSKNLTPNNSHSFNWLKHENGIDLLFS